LTDGAGLEFCSIGGYSFKRRIGLTCSTSHRGRWASN